MNANKREYVYVFRPKSPNAPSIEVKGRPCDPPHMRQFLDAIRSRKQPNADVVYSHYLAAICHMGNMAYEKGKRITWNPKWDVEELS